MALAATVPSPSPAPHPWLYGPAADLLLGCGLLYAFFFVLQALDGAAMRAWLPALLLPFLTLVLGAPHYGATLLRVYERAEERRRYAFFSVWATLAIAALYVASLRSFALGSLLVTLYFTWSPWHYSGQNYGVAVLFLRRRGVDVSPGAKRLLQGTFVLSYALVFLALHTAGPSVQQAPGSVEGTVYRFPNLGIPTQVRDLLATVLLGAYLVCAAGAAWRLRGARLRDLGPTAAVVLVQAAWFLVPTAAGIWGTLQGLDPLAAEQRPYAFIWIAVGHFVQYLWITSYHARTSPHPAGQARFLAKALLAGASVWTLPALLFSPGALGRLPFDLGLGLLTASAVNLHHFVLDGAIWKLRDGRVARALLRPPTAAALSPPESVWRPWLRRVAWVGGSLAVVVALLGDYETLLGNYSARNADPERVRVAVQRRAWLGKATPTVHLALARQALRRGDVRAALFEIEKAQAIYPSADAWILRAALHESAGEWALAARAMDEALALDGTRVDALVGSARALQQLGDASGALARLERAHARDPENRVVRLSLDRLRDEVAASRPEPPAPNAPNL